MPNLYETFKKYQVEADSVTDFISKYYRPERITDTLIESNEAHVKEFGFTFISNHDSITHSIVSYYPPLNGESL